MSFRRPRSRDRDVVIERDDGSNRYQVSPGVVFGCGCRGVLGLCCSAVRVYVLTREALRLMPVVRRPGINRPHARAHIHAAQVSTQRGARSVSARGAAGN